MCDKTRKYIIRNANTRDMIGFALIENKLKENKFSRLTDAVVKKSDMIISSDNTRVSDRLKLILRAVVKKDMIDLNFDKYLTLDRVKWRQKIHITDPN